MVIVYKDDGDGIGSDNGGGIGDNGDGIGSDNGDGIGSDNGDGIGKDNDNVDNGISNDNVMEIVIVMLIMVVIMA